MKKIELNVYSFSELKGEAAAKAREIVELEYGELTTAHRVQFGFLEDGTLISDNLSTCNIAGSEIEFVDKDRTIIDLLNEEGLQGVELHQLFDWIYEKHLPKEILDAFEDAEDFWEIFTEESFIEKIAKDNDLIENPMPIEYGLSNFSQELREVLLGIWENMDGVMTSKRIDELKEFINI